MLGWGSTERRVREITITTAWYPPPSSLLNFYVCIFCILLFLFLSRLFISDPHHIVVVVLQQQQPRQLWSRVTLPLFLFLKALLFYSVPSLLLLPFSLNQYNSSLLLSISLFSLNIDLPSNSHTLKHIYQYRCILKCLQTSVCTVVI